MFKKKTFILLILLVLVALLMGRWFQTGFRSQVDSAVVKIDTAIDAVPAIINVRSDYTFTLSSEEGGRVASSELVLGASIQAQETVLQIDPQDLELDIRILKAEIKNLESRLQLKAQDAANLSKKEEDLANYERLFKAGSYPELEIQRRRRDFAVFKEALALKELNEAQQLNSMQARLERLERRLAKTTIQAPSDGIVTSIYAYPGELVNSGSSLAEVFSRAIVIEAKINEEDFSGVRPGLDATVRLLTYGKQLYKAQVERVLPTADKENQQYTALLSVDIDPDKLLPGLSGEASIIRRKIPEALVIPRRALMGGFVFKIVDEQAVMTPVKVGVKGLNYVEIKDGLNQGDRIITDGMDGLKDGDHVRF